MGGISLTKSSSIFRMIKRNGNCVALSISSRQCPSGYRSVGFPMAHINTSTTYSIRLSSIEHTNASSSPRITKNKHTHTPLWRLNQQQRQPVQKSKSKQLKHTKDQKQ